MSEFLIWLFQFKALALAIAVSEVGEMWPSEMDAWRLFARLVYCNEEYFL